jgi:hypothetical protein
MQTEREIILTCQECGHTEIDAEHKLLMLKVRMYNHINHMHPVLAERFKDVVEEHTAPAY